MKFRDPKTGEVFEHTRDAINAYCGRECDDCPLAIENNQKHLFCFEYVSKFPIEAAPLMGYEVIDDSSTESSSDSSTEIDESPTDTPTTLDDTPTGRGDRPTEEDEMKCYRNGGCGPYEQLSCGECPASKPEYNREENDGKTKHGKPRLAEVLGVEVGERFRVGDVGCDFWIEADGWPRSELFDRNASAKWVVNAINHPESVVHGPRLTEPEVAIMRDCGAKWVSRGDATTSLSLLWEVKPRKYPDGVFRSCWYEPIAKVDPRLFPSVKPGDCIELEEAK